MLPTFRDTNVAVCVASDSLQPVDDPDDYPKLNSSNTSTRFESQGGELMSYMREYHLTLEDGTESLAPSIANLATEWSSGG